MISCVMLCTYPRRAEFIGDALLSYDLQTHRDRELVIINDGSALEPMRGDVTVVNVAPGMSIGEKRNVGLRVASGEWVATWDDDDFSFPERLETLLRNYGHAAAVRSSRMWVSDQTLRIAGLVSGACYPTSIIRRREALDVGGYPDISWLEDMELAMRLATRGFYTALCGEPIYVHRRHGANASEAHDSLVNHLRRSLPQYEHMIPAAQHRIDSLLSVPRVTLVLPA